MAGLSGFAGKEEDDVVIVVVIVADVVDVDVVVALVDADEQLLRTLARILNFACKFDTVLC